VEPALLERLTDFLSFRGPDAQRAWARGPVGFGHTLLRTAAESENEQQPFTLDGNAWIVADARVDRRRELIAALQPHTRKHLNGIPDAELILCAYQVWGRNCVDHLIGDFVFAIWDDKIRRLFCARDHFGMKPFYYARTSHSLIFSNTLDCLRLHPGISDRLNDLAIADFLMFDNNENLSTTAFADILRLAPAHTLECSDGSVTTSRYWSLPEVTPLDNVRPQECLDHFREVFDAAVADRLRADSAGLLLSGGLDSPTVAASIRRVLTRRGSPFDLRAYTHVHDRLIPHEERHYAGLVARSLEIPIQFLVADDCRLYDHYDDPEFRTPEPAHFPMGFRDSNPFQEIAAFSRTALTGYGGDPALASLLTAHFRRLFQARKFGRMITDAAGYLAAEGRLSRLYLRTRLRHRFGRKENTDFFPWLDPELVKRLGLRDRWEQVGAEAPSSHSARPEGHAAVASPSWTATFEPLDAGILRSNIQVCHPFFDLRVLTFLLALPALPWCSDKEILRRAARGVLPDAVRLRKKSPLITDPIMALLQKPESAWVDSFKAVPELREFVQRDRIPGLYKTADAFSAWTHLKPLSLNFWLQRRSFARPAATLCVAMTQTGTPALAS
jgi:asparagine synthase (glutamine-hydrolysing)